MNASRSIKRFAQLLICLAIVIGMTQTGPSQDIPAAKYNYTTVDIPLATQTRLSGINDRGQMVGQYRIAGPWFGFLKSGDTSETFQYGTMETGANGINRAGDVVGYLWDGGTNAMKGFLIHDGIREDIRPGNGASLANGINDKGSIVGEYKSDGSTTFAVSEGASTAFVYSNGVYTSIDNVNPTPTSALGINNKGQIVGEAGNYGYFRDGDTVRLLEFPGASRTVAIGINNSGDIVGVYYIGSDPAGRGFLFSNGAFMTVDVQGAFATIPTDIHNHGEIVGRYSDINGSHGFLAVPQKGKR